MNTGLNTYFWLAWPLLTDSILLCAGLLFVVRLYLVERRFEEGLIGYERAWSKRKMNPAFVPLPEEEWFLAHGFEYQATGASPHRRMGKLRKIARLLVVTMMSIVSLFGAGALFAATSTGSLAVSAMVLSRCLIRFPSFSGKVESNCSDGVQVTKEVSDKVMSNVSEAATSSAAAIESALTPSATPRITTVTLTY